MATTARKAFEDFTRRIALTEVQRKLVRDRRTATEGYLEKKFGDSSNMSLLSVSLIGSAQRSTMIRPPDDVDVLAVFDASEVWEDSSIWTSDGYRHNSTRLLYRVRDALNDYSIKVVGSRGQAVRLFYDTGGHVDVVPAFRRSGGGYVIPAGDRTWQATDPFAHHEFVSQRHKDLGEHLKPLAKKLKQWNRAHSQRLSSFHIEVMVAEIFTSLGGDSRKATKLFFEHAPQHLHVHDPAGHSGDLAKGFSWGQKQDVLKSFNSAADRARKAVDAELASDHEEAIRQWRIVFGSDHFPVYG